MEVGDEGMRDVDFSGNYWVIRVDVDYAWKVVFREFFLVLVFVWE